MKVNFYSVAILAVCSMFQSSEAVPLHTMSTSQTETGIQVDLASLSEQGQTGKPVHFTLGSGETKNINLTSTFTPKGTTTSSAPVTKPACGCATKITSGGVAESALNSLVKQTNTLTSALMDKMTADIMKGDPKPCTLQDRLEQGFDLAFEDFDINGLVPECKPAPPKKCDCPTQNAVLTIGVAEDTDCAPKKSTSSTAVLTPTIPTATTTKATATTAPAPTVQKATTTTAPASPTPTATTTTATTSTAAATT